MVFSSDNTAFDNIEIGQDFLKARITIARPGVFPYYVQGGNGQPVLKKRAKLPEDLFSADTLTSADGIPVTDGHPRENGRYILLNNENYKDYSRGSISTPIVASDTLQANVTIYDKNLINKIVKDNIREASIGFIFKEAEKPGTFNGETYDSEQKEMKINHVAIVPKGRAGSDVKINFDCAGFDEDDVQGNNVLSSKARNDMEDSEFAVPDERKFPIPDISHARNASRKVFRYQV